MSVLHSNECRYRNCGKVFNCLNDLIVHIEKDHLDFSNEAIQQFEMERPDCLPLSYVLRYSNDRDPSPQFIYKTEPTIANNKNEILIHDNHHFSHYDYEILDIPKHKIDEHGLPNDLRLINSSIADIIPYKSYRTLLPENHKKPFACNMPGCHKRYKNVNGVKYHYRSYHKFFNAPNMKRSVLKYNNNMNYHLPASSSSSLKVKVENNHELSVPLMNFSSQLHHEMNYKKIPPMIGFGRNEDFIDINSNFYNMHVHNLGGPVEPSDPISYFNINCNYHTLAKVNNTDID